MRNTLSLLIVSVLLLYGCVTKTDKQTSITTNNVDLTNTYQVVEASPFCPALQSELKDYIQKQHDPFANVIRIWIVERNGNCYLDMASDICYDTRSLCGYYIMDSIMIAYDYIKRDDDMSFLELYELLDSVDRHVFFKESECNNGIIDTTLLIRNAPVDFPNEEQICGTYDGRGRKYKIHSPDSLELVFEGYY